MPKVTGLLSGRIGTETQLGLGPKTQLLGQLVLRREKLSERIIMDFTLTAMKSIKHVKQQTVTIRFIS